MTKDVLSKMTPEEYAKHQNALAARMLEKDKNLGQESSRLWTHVSSRYYYFEQHVEDAERVSSSSVFVHAGPVRVIPVSLGIGEGNTIG